MADCSCREAAEAIAERSLLWRMLGINGLMFALELLVGLGVGSMALVADALDMLADALVYGLALAAVGGDRRRKRWAAAISGGLQILIALVVLGSAVNRFFHPEVPKASWMIGISVIALIANLYCFSLITRHRKRDIHIRASWIFSRNDVIANIGVIVAALGVWIFEAGWPDLLMGCAITLVVLWGGMTILADVRRDMA